MKLQTRHPGGRTLLAAIIGTGMLVTGSIAHASTAATATVRNIVTVNYADAASNPQTAITAAVDVTVNLVRANPVLNAPVDITTDAATNAVYNYTITNASNGITTYNLTTSVDAESAGISGSTAVAAPTSVTLGGSTVAVGTTIAPTGVTDITVPRDDTADMSVNGIAAGDTIVIGGQVFTVASVVDAQVPASPANGPYTTIITVIGNGTPLPVSVADPIYERQTLTVTVDPGVVTDASVDQTIDVTLTATDSVNGAFLATDATVTTVSGVGLQVQKLVRNVDTGVVGSGLVSYFGVDYYSGGVTGNPGQVLEYLVVVSKSGAASATNVRVSDPIPPFTTYVTTSMSIDNAGTGAFTALNDSDSNGDAGETDANTVYFYPGTGGTDGAAGVGNGSGGTITGANVSRMKFQVTIQ